MVTVIDKKESIVSRSFNLCYIGKEKMWRLKYRVEFSCGAIVFGTERYVNMSFVADALKTFLSADALLKYKL